jgi:hypothetical protein
MNLDMERQIQEIAAVCDYVRGVRKSPKRLWLSFDEWNVWYRARSGNDVNGQRAAAPALLEEVYNLEDALLVGGFLNSLLRQSDRVRVGCLAQLLNVIAPLTTNATSVLRHTIYYPYAWALQYARGRVLDLRMEGAAACELAQNMREELRFRVPAIDWARTSARVLTLEWMEGTPLRDADALRAAGHDPRAIAVTVLQTFLTQALRDGFFHADLHPGNLFVDAEGRVCAVDFGIMGRLDLATRRFLAETLGGFLARDYLRVAEVHFEAGFVPRTHHVETFAQALRAVGEPIFGLTARDVSMARLLDQLFETTRRFDMQMQPQLILLQKTMVVVEGVCRVLDPEFDIWASSRPVIERWMVANLGPEARLRMIDPSPRCVVTTLAHGDDLQPDPGILRAIAAHNRPPVPTLGGQQWPSVGVYGVVVQGGVVRRDDTIRLAAG